MARRYRRRSVPGVSTSVPTTQHQWNTPLRPHLALACSPTPTTMHMMPLFARVSPHSSLRATRTIGFMPVQVNRMLQMGLVGLVVRRW